ncbi:unnamed protein product, partial [Staurois parvus]
QGRTDNSWGPRAIGDHGALVSLPKLKKAYEKKGTRGISWGPLLTLGPRAVSEFPKSQSAPGEQLWCRNKRWTRNKHGLLTLPSIFLFFGESKAGLFYFIF